MPKSSYLLPDDFEIVNVDWEKQSRILPERYIVRLDDNLLDRHSYNREDEIEERSPRAYELTKEKARKALHLFRNIPLQIEHGTDGVDPKTGFTRVHTNRCVVGKVVKAWINPEKDHQLLCEVKFDNKKSSSLFWNCALYKSAANRGASLKSTSNYDIMIPNEVSLVERGMRPNTGVISVIDKDEKIIDFKEYRLQHDKEEEPTQPLSPAPPLASSDPIDIDTEQDPSTQDKIDDPVIETSSLEISSEMQVAPASANQPKDPNTGKYISVAEAQSRGLVPIPFTPAPPQQQQTAVMQRDPSQQQQRYEPETKEYPMDANYNGVPHTSMIGTPMEGIAMSEHARYQQEAIAKAQTAATANSQQASFMQSIANTPGGGGAPVPMRQQAPVAAAPATAASDTKMEDVEESQDAVDDWFDKASDADKEKEYKSAMQKIMNGRIKELTKKESLVHADRSVKHEKERQDSFKKLEESSKEQKQLMQTFLSALSSLKPTTTAEEHKAMEGLTPTQAVTQLVAAASGRMASLETQNQMYQQWLEETNKRQKQENSLPRHLQRIANQYADLSSSAVYPGQQQQQQQAPPPPPLHQLMTVPASYHSMPQQQQQQAPPPPQQRKRMSHAEEKQMLAAMMSGTEEYQDYNYVPTSTPAPLPPTAAPMQIVPAGYNHGSNSRSNTVVGGKRSYQDQQQQQQQDQYFAPDRNTKVDSDWLNHEKFGKYFSNDLKSSFMRASSTKLNGWTDTENIPFHIIAPTFYTKSNELAKQAALYK